MAGITIKPAQHPASCMLSPDYAKSSADFLDRLRPNQQSKIIQSSFENSPPERLLPSDNGFVTAAISAYNGHQHLVIRPDDVWLAILTQFSSYVNAHAEELRGSFVAHEGKKTLSIVYPNGTRDTVDWAVFAERIGVMIQKNVVDDELRDWILPKFSTTTERDVAVGSTAMMASMQTYFSYKAYMLCGLPSVTLLGEKADYELILQRLGKLRSYGKEPKCFANLLTPVLKRFIRSFDDPSGEEIIDFWNRIFSSRLVGSGSAQYSGWITAFMLWDKNGRSLRPEYFLDSSDNDDDDDDVDDDDDDNDDESSGLSLDGWIYHSVCADEVPPGLCTVPVSIVDNGIEIEAEMLAGSIGMACSSSGQTTADGQPGIDTMQPCSGWWIYEKK